MSPPEQLAKHHPNLTARFLHTVLPRLYTANAVVKTTPDAPNARSHSSARKRTTPTRNVWRIPAPRSPMMPLRLTMDSVVARTTRVRPSVQSPGLARSRWTTTTTRSACEVIGFKTEWRESTAAPQRAKTCSGLLLHQLGTKRNWQCPRSTIRPKPRITRSKKLPKRSQQVEEIGLGHNTARGISVVRGWRTSEGDCFFDGRTSCTDTHLRRRELGFKVAVYSHFRRGTAFNLVHIQYWKVAPMYVACKNGRYCH